MLSLYTTSLHSTTFFASASACGSIIPQLNLHLYVPPPWHLPPSPPSPKLTLTRPNIEKKAIIEGIIIDGDQRRQTCHFQRLHGQMVMETNRRKTPSSSGHSSTPLTLELDWIWIWKLELELELDWAQPDVITLDMTDMTEDFFFDIIHSLPLFLLLFSVLFPLHPTADLLSLTSCACATFVT